jgi:chromate reductase, NAD(P)H dehydrogenase (quinone)
MSFSGERADAPLRILGVPGSVREGSANLRLLRVAGRALGDQAELTTYLQPKLAAFPPFQPELEPPECARELRAALDAADGLLIASPEYNASLPGGLKNLLDWAAGRPAEEGALWGMPAAVIGCGRDRFGGDWAQADARKVLEAAGGRVVASGLSVPYAESAFDPADGGLRDEELLTLLHQVLDQLLAESRAGRVRAHV